MAGSYGALVNQIWSVAGSEDTVAVDQLYLQPFVDLQLRKSGTGLTVNTELTAELGGVDPTAFVRHHGRRPPAVRSGSIVQIQVGPRIPVAAPEGGKADFGVRAAVIFVFPK